ncbi:MAG: hypothetical protein WC521_07540 [Bdellovibrionales bacterium]|jgi:hypothetical protein
MASFIYNDSEFIVKAGGWDIVRKLPNGTTVMLGTNLFDGLSPAEAEAKALSLAHTINPVGVKIVGPDVNHPNKIGNLKIVGPDVAHPNFIYWDKDSSSFPKVS